MNKQLKPFSAKNQHLVLTRRFAVFTLAGKSSKTANKLRMLFFDSMELVADNG